MLRGGNPSLLSSPPPPLLNALSLLWEGSLPPWAGPPLCPTLSSFFRLASLSAWPAPASDLTSPFHQGDHCLLTLKGSYLLPQGKAGGRIGLALESAVPYSMFPHKSSFQSPVQGPCHDWRGTRWGQNFIFDPLKPEGMVSLFHAWAWGWWSTEHLVCPTYRVCKAWASCFLKCRNVYLHCCLGRLPRPDDASELPRELRDSRGAGSTVWRAGSGICSSQHIWGDSEAAGRLRLTFGNNWHMSQLWINQLRWADLRWGLWLLDCSELFRDP